MSMNKKYGSLAKKRVVGPVIYFTNHVFAKTNAFKTGIQQRKVGKR
jgi:hypothetical protein